MAPQIRAYRITADMIDKGVAEVSFGASPYHPEN